MGKNNSQDNSTVKSLVTRGVLLKGTARKITSQEGGFAGLLLMNSVLTPLSKNVLLPFGLSAGMSAADAAIQKTFMDHELLY